MSRSRQTNPIISYCVVNHSAIRKFQNTEKRRLRRKVNQLLKLQKYDNFPQKQDYGNLWSDPRDGKQYLRLGKHQRFGLSFEYTEKELKRQMRK